MSTEEIDEGIEVLPKDCGEIGCADCGCAARCAHPTLHSRRIDCPVCGHTFQLCYDMLDRRGEVC